MTTVKLTKKEQDWLIRLEKCLAAAPKTLNSKVRAYTIGDPDIILYCIKTLEDRENERYGCRNNTIADMDICVQVEVTGAEIANFVFPFVIESTAW